VCLGAVPLEWGALGAAWGLKPRKWFGQLG